MVILDADSGFASALGIQLPEFYWELFDQPGIDVILTEDGFPGTDFGYVLLQFGYVRFELLAGCFDVCGTGLRCTSVEIGNNLCLPQRPTARGQGKDDEPQETDSDSLNPSTHCGFRIWRVGFQKRNDLGIQSLMRSAIPGVFLVAGAASVAASGSCSGSSFNKCSAHPLCNS